MSTTQVEIELLRNLGAAAISLGQQYHQYADFLGNGPATSHAAPSASAPPPFPAAAPAPGAPAAPDTSAAGGRKRRTKAEIAADDAAIAEGYTSHADKLAKTGGAVAAQVPAPGVQPVSGLPGHVPAPLPPGAAVTPPPPPQAVPPAPAPVTTAHDTLQAALMAFGQAVENTWPGQGHGNGQMGLIVAKMNVPNIQAVPAENVQAWTDWIVDITNRFRADPSKLAELTK